jgi:hypothetical protein
MRRTPHRRSPRTDDHLDKNPRPALRAAMSVILLVLLISAGSLCVPNFYVDDIQSLSGIHEDRALLRSALMGDEYRPLWMPRERRGHSFVETTTRSLEARAFICPDSNREDRPPGVRAPPARHGCLHRDTRFERQSKDPMTHCSMDIEA